MEKKILDYKKIVKYDKPLYYEIYCWLARAFVLKVFFICYPGNERPPLILKI